MLPHEYPAVKHGDGSYELYKDKHGFVLGGMEDISYKDYEQFDDLTMLCIRYKGSSK